MSLVFPLKKLDPRAVIPAQGTPMAAGFDVVACINEPLVLKHGDPAVLIPTGLAIYMGAASSTVAALILPRSGLGHKHGLVLGNTIGLVDGDYQNQWFISAFNRGNARDAEGNYLDIVIQPGERIAQIVFVPVLHPQFQVVEDFEDETLRGLGGFGSTGRQ